MIIKDPRIIEYLRRLVEEDQVRLVTQRDELAKLSKDWLDREQTSADAMSIFLLGGENE